MRSLGAPPIDTSKKALGLDAALPEGAAPAVEVRTRAGARHEASARRNMGQLERVPPAAARAVTTVARACVQSAAKRLD